MYPHRLFPRLLTLVEAVAVLTLVASPPASAATILPSVDSGWYRDTGFHSTAYDPNYFLGNYAQDLGSGLRQVFYRDFFVFDLTGVGYITAATLHVQNNGPYAGVPGTLTIWNVAMAMPSILAEYTDTDATGLSAYASLGSGTALGSTSVDSSVGNTFLDIALDPSLLALGGKVVLGGSLSGGMGADQWLFFNNGIAQLQVTTPEPNSFYFIIGGAMLALFSRRTSKCGGPGA